MDIASPLSDPNMVNNHSEDVIDIFSTGGGPGVYQDASITKIDSSVAGYGPDPVAMTGNVTYRLRILNRGPSHAPTGRVITINDYIPSNATVMSVTPVDPTELCGNQLRKHAPRPWKKPVFDRVVHQWAGALSVYPTTDWSGF